MRLVPPATRRGALGLLAWALVVVVADRRVHDALTSPFRSADLDGLYRAGQAVLHGRPVYAGTGLAYPPTAAFAAAPLAALGRPVFVHALVWSEAVSLMVLAVLAVRSVTRSWTAVLSAAVAAVLLRSDAAVIGMAVGNISLVLAPVGAAVVLLLVRRRVGLALLLLVTSLLIKPLLLPLVLLPLLVGRVRLVASVGAAGAALLGAVLVLGKGSSGLGSLLHFLVFDDLKGKAAGYNYSFAGLGQAQGWSVLVVAALRLAVALAVVAAVARLVRLRACGPTGLVLVSGVVTLGALLVGPLNEVHYVFLVVFPSVVALRMDGSRVVRVVLAVSLGLLLLPARYVLPGVAAESQIRWVVGQTVILACLVVLVLRTEAGVLRGGLAALPSRLSPVSTDGAALASSQRSRAVR